jgi:hypothetical protein
MKKIAKGRETIQARIRTISIHPMSASTRLRDYFRSDDLRSGPTGPAKESSRPTYRTSEGWR